MGAYELRQEETAQFALELSRLASENGMVIESCAEHMNLSKYGIHSGRCIDKRRIERILGCTIAGGKDPNQREECGCMESVEIGAYNTCLNGCRYCYANVSQRAVERIREVYDPQSPLLCGRLGEEDRITERKAGSLKERQLSLWNL